MRLIAAELTRQGGRIDPKALLVLLVVGAALGAGIMAWQPEAPDPDAGIFRVQAEPDAALTPVAASDHRFIFVDDGPADLVLAADTVIVQDNDRSRAAYEVLVAALQTWQDDRLATEADQPAAFPLDITVAYQARQVPPAQATPPPEPAPGRPTQPSPGDPPVLDEAEPTGPVQENLRPADVDPPFPIRSLLLTFAYVLPASLLAQVHGAGLHAERTRHRGILLLSAPVGPTQILIGKSTPALIVLVAIAAVVTLVLGAGWLGFLAAMAFLWFLFASTSLLALVSRSPRELSLLQVASTTLLNVFLFLPAMFPSIPPVAFLSPVHVVASGIRGDAVTLGQFLYATMPLTVAGFGLAALAVGLLRDELLFSVRSTPRRMLAALDVITRSPARVLAAGALVVPFVFAAQILVLVLASVLGLRVAFIAWLPLSVLLEEIAKGLPIWARDRPKPWLTALLVGSGFFLAEKGYLVLTLVGFDGLPFGREALALLGTGPGLLLLMLPLAVHVGTAMALSYGAAKGRPIVGFAVAAGAHLAYDQVLLGGLA